MLIHIGPFPCSFLFQYKIHYDEASEPYAVTLGEKTYYYIRNAVGDIKGLISADTGEYVLSVITSAYGVLLFTEPDATFDTSSIIDPTIQIIKLMLTYALRSAVCIASASTYKGYSYDVDTGLYYLQSRYYDPEIGRFINADDVDYLGASGKPISYNLFAYCENNPVNNSDPGGRISKETFKKIGEALKKVLEYIEKICNAFLKKYGVSKKRYVNLTKYNTPSKVFSYVNNNKRAIKNFRNNISSIAKFLGIVLDIVAFASVLSKDKYISLAVAGLVFDGLIRLMGFVGEKIILTVFKSLVFMKLLINVLFDLLLDYLERSGWLARIKTNYLTYVNPKQISFKNYFVALFKGIKKTFA